MPTLCSQAIAIIKNYFYEKYKVNINIPIYDKRVKEWYENSDIGDAFILAAVAINSEYNPCYSQKDILQIANDIFPE